MKPAERVSDVAAIPELAVELQRELGQCTSVDELLRTLARGLAPLLPVRDRVSVVFLDPDGELMRIYRVLPTFDGPVGGLPRVRIDGTPVGRVVREGVGRITDARENTLLSLGHASRDGIRSTASVPIRVAGRVIGALNAGSYVAGTCTEDMLSLLQDLATWIGPAVFAADQLLNEPSGWPSLEEHGRRYILKVLERCDGVIEGPSGAAQMLGLRPSTLRSRMQRLGITAGPMRPKGRRR